MILLIIPFVLIVYCLSSTELSMFFFSTSVFITTFFGIGLPLSNTFYINRFNSLYPEEKPWAGDGFGMLVAIVFYITISISAWIIALIFTIYIRKFEMVDSKNSNKKDNNIT